MKSCPWIDNSLTFFIPLPRRGSRAVANKGPYVHKRHKQVISQQLKKRSSHKILKGKKKKQIRIRNNKYLFVTNEPRAQIVFHIFRIHSNHKGRIKGHPEL